MSHWKLFTNKSFDEDKKFQSKKKRFSTQDTSVDKKSSVKFENITLDKQRKNKRLKNG